MIRTPNCFKRECKHFLGVSQPDGTELTERVVCKAFPDGIPAEIAFGDNLHDRVRDDQVGDYVYQMKGEPED